MTTLPPTGLDVRDRRTDPVVVLRCRQLGDGMTNLEARVFHLEAAFARLLVQYAADTGKKDDIVQIFATFIKQTEKLGGLSENDMRKVLENND